MNKPRCLSLALACSIALLAACGTPRPSATHPVSPTVNDDPKASPLRPIGGVTTSATIALARYETGRLAFVADEDAKAILTIDPDTKKELASTNVEGTPGQLLVTADGALLVTLREASKVLRLRFVSPGARLVKQKEVATAAEPIAMALAADDTVLVSSGWGRRLTALALGDLGPRYEVRLPREPRSVVVSDDGKTAFVSHAVGSAMSAVDLGAGHATTIIPLRAPNASFDESLASMKKAIETMKKVRAPALEEQTKVFLQLEKRAREGRESCQGFALAKSSSIPNRIFGPQVMVDPGDLEHRAGGYGEGIPEVPAVAVVDEAERKALPPSMTSRVRGRTIHKLGHLQPESPECLLPRAAATPSIPARVRPSSSRSSTGRSRRSPSRRPPSSSMTRAQPPRRSAWPSPRSR